MNGILMETGERVHTPETFKDTIGCNLLIALDSFDEFVDKHCIAFNLSNGRSFVVVETFNK